MPQALRLVALPGAVADPDVDVDRRVRLGIGPDGREDQDLDADPHRERGNGGPIGHYSADQSARAVGQLLLGVRVLERVANWTEFGGRAFAAMRAKVGTLRSLARERGISLSVPAWVCRPNGEMRPKRTPAGETLTVREDLRNHAAQFDFNHESWDLIDSPHWSI